MKIFGLTLFEGNKPQEVEVVNKATKGFPDLEVSNFLDYSSFGEFRTMSSNRKAQYQTYDNMLSDTVVSSAIEMYADDATQYGSDGRAIWVTADDTDTENVLNSILEELDIESELWGMYYALAAYGDVYIRLFKKPVDITEEGFDNALNQYELSKEICNKPEDIFDLVSKGKTVQFAFINRTYGVNKQERIELYPSDQFVHILIKRPVDRDEQKFEFKTKTEDGNLVNNVYDVKRGKSMIHDLYGAQREVELLESTLMLNRLSRSSITRMVSVEVGDMPKTEVRELLRRVKTSIESKISISSSKAKGYLSPGQIDNVVVSPTRNGKGSITTTNVGGDVDVKSLLDMDYFNNKRFSGLKIPKAFLGYDDSIAANSGGTLTKLDNRYGRTIKRLQKAMQIGITDLLNLFLLDRGMASSIGKFKVNLVSPTTIDEIDRLEMRNSEISYLGSILSAIRDVPGIDIKEVAELIARRDLNDSELADIIKKAKTPSPEEQEQMGY